MYRVLLAIKDNRILQELKRLRIWGISTGFEICKVISEMDSLIDHMRETKYDLLFLEESAREHELKLLQSIKRENLCKAMVIVSQKPEYKMVRRSFLLGADDYLVPPFEISPILAVFGKIENAGYGKLESELCKKEELLDYFERRDPSFRDFLSDLFCRVFGEYRGGPEAVGDLTQVLNSTVAELFERHSWLDFYFLEEDYQFHAGEETADEALIQKHLDDLYTLFLEFTELYPAHGEGLDEILLYILNHPEGDLKQKTVAEELYINRSYLSTVFAVQTGVNFVDYVNTVRMKRAAYLLKNTKRKVIDIAGVVGYKDMGYFLKKFKAKYGVTPSQYRIPETYDFQI